MRFALAACVLVVLAPPAVADRRAKPSKFDVAAGEAFAAAERAESKNDLKLAIGFYEKSFKITPHPSTAFNLAEVCVRYGSFDAALHWYEAYLALAPTAADRDAVRKLMTELETRPTTYTISSGDTPEHIDVKQAYVLVDGAIVKRPGTASINVPLAPGRHAIDVVTALTVASKRVNVELGGGSKSYQPVGPPRVDGTVVFSSNGPCIRYGRQEQCNPANGAFSSMHAADEAQGLGRFSIGKGKQLLEVYDEDFECAPERLDAPGGDSIAYIHIAVTNPTKGPEHCRKLRVTRQTLVFK